MDRDIQGSLENLNVAEGIVKHHWIGIDRDKYANPAKKVMYNFAPKLDGISSTPRPTSPPPRRSSIMNINSHETSLG